MKLCYLSKETLGRSVSILLLAIGFQCTALSERLSAQILFSQAMPLNGDGSAPMEIQVLPSFAGGGASVFSTSRLPNDTARLLRTPQIAEELGLDDEQSAAINALSKAMGSQISDVMKTIDFGGPDSQRIMQEAQRTIREKTQEKLEEVLTPDQLKRLGQIKVQSAFKSRGAMALTVGFLGDEIRLTDKQKNLLKSVNAKKQKELRDKIAALREQCLEETIDAVLTDEQEGKLKRMIGDPYQVKQPDYRKRFQRQIKPQRETEAGAKSKADE